MAVLVFLVLFLAMAGHSSASFCVCKDGFSDAVLQKNIDYACGAGADCSQISQSGPCFNPNTVKDHCNYAVNSYYQKKGQTAQACDFAGTATVTASVSSTNSACVFPSSGGNAGTTTPSTTPTGGISPPTTGTGTTTPTTPVGGISPPSTGTGTGGTGTGTGGTGTGTGIGATPGSGTGTNTPIGVTPPSTTSPIFGLGPTGSGGTTGINESKAATTVNLHQNTLLFWSLTLALLFSCPMFYFRL